MMAFILTGKHVRLD